MFSCALLACLLAGLVTYFVVNKTYAATSSVYISAPIGATAADLNQGGDYVADQVKSFSKIAVSELNMASVQRALGLEQSPAEIAAQVTVSVPPGTTIIDITARADDAVAAAALANETAVQLGTVLPSVTSSVDGTARNVRPVILTAAVPASAQVTPDFQTTLAVSLLAGLALGIALHVGREGIRRLRSAGAARSTPDSR